jgi:VIT1/CCC1 family predicted Fe2+/Mn2+ transporter
MADKSLKEIRRFQRSELTDHYLYLKLAKRQKDPHNQQVLNDIAKDELIHYHFWKKLTNKELKPYKFHLWFYYFISILFGITFGIRLMEKGEDKTQGAYRKYIGKIDNIEKLIADEEEHEEALIKSINEEKLNYVGSMVLGLNDALVELTGTLAGLTFALANSKIVALSGLITGIAASLSMASSEYLSTKQESNHSKALKSSLYTGVAYIITVILMILPFLLLPADVDFNIFGLIIPSIYLALSITILVVIFIILTFTFYISVAKNLGFKRRFFEMICISLGVAFLSFLVGYLVKIIFNLEA